MNPTTIPWCDSTWNPFTGCTKGCEYCYARKRASFGNINTGEGSWSPAPSPYYEAAEGDRWPVKFTPTLYPHRLDEPLRRKKPATIFLGSMGDLFDPAIPDSFRDAVFVTVAQARQHTFVVLTKRAEAMRRYFGDDPDERRHSIGAQIPGRMTLDAPLPNLWPGVTATNQADADERIPLLLDTPAAHRFVSVEPMMGPLELTDIERHAAGRLQAITDALAGVTYSPDGEDSCDHAKLDLVIAGAKTPGKALHEQNGCEGFEDRRCRDGWCNEHPNEAYAHRQECRLYWLRSLRDQCLEAGVPFHYKHGGKNPELDGVVYDWRPGR